MTGDSAWPVALLTVSLLLAYEIGLLLVQRRSPSKLARSAHASLREEWFGAVSRLPGSEILAVQTLRNALMSATMSASAALLGLMGALTLAIPSLHAAFDGADAPGAHLTPRLALELVLMLMLFGSMVCAATAVRYYNHAGFIGAMPVGSDERRRWSATAVIYLRRAGLLYGWGLRHLLMVAPVAIAIVYPPAGPVAALLLIGALAGFDRLPAGPVPGAGLNG